MAISIAKVKELREKTGVGVMDAKNALEEAGGDIANAEKILSEKGLASASKRSGRSTSEGSVVSYIHTGGRIGSMLEIKCETDFVGKTKEFAELGKNISMQIAAMNPIYIDAENETNDKDIEPTSENSLLQQVFIKDSEKTIKSLIEETSGKLGENIQIKRFQRFAISD